MRIWMVSLSGDSIYVAFEIVTQADVRLFSDVTVLGSPHAPVNSPNKLIGSLSLIWVELVLCSAVGAGVSGHLFISPLEKFIRHHVFSSTCWEFSLP